jgi:NAD(P)-dependent dehydrogenase (short-subunit alcohol dehydrogenase family)
MKMVDGQTAVVTGGASGLGLATAFRLLNEGARVAIWDVNEAQLADAAKTIDAGDRLITCEVDVGDPRLVKDAADLTKSKFGAPSILVAAAGISGLFRPYLEYPIDVWHEVIRVNLTGTHLVCEALLPAMIQSGYGRVVTVSSMAGKDGNALMVGYSAAKAGVIGFTKALGRELAKTGVVVNCIAPALFDTPLVRKTTQESSEGMTPMLEKIPMGRMGRPEEFAAMAVWLASKEVSFTTGMIFDVSGGRATH